MPRSRVLPLLSLATTLVAPAFSQSVISARPGTVNYIEGQASLGGQTGGQSLNNSSVGNVSLRAGETLETTRGRAEIMLTPGVFLRIGQDSAVKMISPSLSHTEIELTRGLAEIEADQLYPQNDIRVNLGSLRGVAQTRLEKEGVYEFDAANGVVRVFDGKASVTVGSELEKATSVKGGHLLALNDDSTKVRGFNKKKEEDDLTDWSGLRSRYIGSENAGLGGQPGGVTGFNGGIGDGGGFYPWFPGSAGFFSPFGYGLYSSSFLYGGGFGYGYPGFYPGLGFGGLGYGSGGLGYGGFGYGGYGYGGYGYGGGGYSYVGAVNPGTAGYRGSFNNRGNGGGRPIINHGGSTGTTRSGGSVASAGSRSGAGTSMSRGGGGGGVSSGGGGSHSSSGGGGHR